MTSRLDAGFIC